ncbi:MAG: DNA methyltransferase [Bdellovibrio sp. ArHS]|uniref:MGMT family protein n=1 Tax=Bdellovibrio sp. ArHS TaxID=1569284 RepID=UPI000583A422|nr:MGMT family protein [Bdellovibrio sp. ArHS]KHD88731.1 MAG: DNA methyltransferase [Bdellovibrio sp. ArHS]
MEELNDFSKKVIHFIQKIPLGQVATYGQIAKLAGKPQGSRGVAWILHSSSKAHKLPWHRVINSQGKISFPEASAAFKKQKALLRHEGVVFLDKNKIDLKKFQWKKEVSKKKSLRSPRMFTA